MQEKATGASDLLGPGARGVHNLALASLSLSRFLSLPLLLSNLLLTFQSAFVLDHALHQHVLLSVHMWQSVCLRMPVKRQDNGGLLQTALKHMHMHIRNPCIQYQAGCCLHGQHSTSLAWLYPSETHACTSFLQYKSFSAVIKPPRNSSFWQVNSWSRQHESMLIVTQTAWTASMQHYLSKALAACGYDPLESSGHQSSYCCFVC